MLTSAFASLILAVAVFAAPASVESSGRPVSGKASTGQGISESTNNRATVKEEPKAAAAAGGPAPAKIDLTVLNFALTLEHLEATYYQQGLRKFGLESFKSIGLPGFVLEQFNTIAADEAIHVTFLQKAIAATFGVDLAVPKCTYNFEGALANIESFITFAAILEKTGVQAYDGGIKLIVNNDIKTAAATIATVEGRHSSFLNLLTGAGPAPGPFDTPLGIRPVISIAAGLIKSCPYTLPATPFPALTTVTGRGLTSGTPVSTGSVIPLMFKGGMGMTAATASGMSCNWVFGVEPQVRTRIQMSRDGPECQVPAQITRAAFTQAVVFVVNQQRDVTLDDDKNVVAGPATIFVSGESRVGASGSRQE
ncbi:ferritin-like domain-containing protein [Chytriomyces cf. hyalinus JEL632]|nr:ferritin-like domain-containing protein [Chytriomyces cf. hyalinus JEL632]